MLIHFIVIVVIIIIMSMQVLRTMDQSEVLRSLRLKRAWPGSQIKIEVLMRSPSYKHLDIKRLNFIKSNSVIIK